MLNSRGHRDPRLKRGKEDSDQITVSISDVANAGEYRMVRIDVEEIDYSCYVSFFKSDAKLKNDPRLQKYFGKFPQSVIDHLSQIVPPPLKTAPVTPLAAMKSKKEKEKKERTGLGEKLPPLPPLTISPTKAALKPTLFPPPPPSVMSAIELISSKPVVKTEPSSPDSSNPAKVVEEIMSPTRNDAGHSIVSGLSSIADLVARTSAQRLKQEQEIKKESLSEVTPLNEFDKTDAEVNKEEIKTEIKSEGFGFFRDTFKSDLVVDSQFDNRQSSQPEADDSDRSSEKELKMEIKEEPKDLSLNNVAPLNLPKDEPFTEIRKSDGFGFFRDTFKNDLIDELQFDINDHEQCQGEEKSVENDEDDEDIYDQLEIDINPNKAPIANDL